MSPGDWCGIGSPSPPGMVGQPEEGSTIRTPPLCNNEAKGRKTPKSREKVGAGDSRATRESNSTHIIYLKSLVVL